MPEILPTPPLTETRLHIVTRYLENRGWRRVRIMHLHPDTLWEDPKYKGRHHWVEVAHRYQFWREKGFNLYIQAPPW